MTDQLDATLAPYVVDNQLACEDAHRLAQAAGVTPGAFAQAISTHTAVRFYRCQLGLFGYGAKSEGRSKIVQPARFVPDEISADVLAAADDGQIPCADVWRIAAAHSYPRLGMGNIVESMGLRVKPCQLGCF
jgi:hypothetical protein